MGRTHLGGVALGRGSGVRGRLVRISPIVFRMEVVHLAGGGGRYRGGEWVRGDCFPGFSTILETTSALNWVAEMGARRAVGEGVGATGLTWGARLGGEKVFLHVWRVRLGTVSRLAS